MKDIDPRKLNPEGIGKESEEVKKFVSTFPGIDLEPEPEMAVEEVDEIMRRGLELIGAYNRLTGEYDFDVLMETSEWSRPLISKDSKPLEPSKEIK